MAHQMSLIINTEHTAWKNYIFKHRLRPKNKSIFELQEFDIPLPLVATIGSSARRTPPANSGAIVPANNFTKRASYTVKIDAADDNGLIVDIPLADLDMIFNSKLPFNPSTNLYVEFYFETNNKKLAEINANLLTRYSDPH